MLILSSLTLYGTVVWGLLHYSTKQSYRYWGLGWIIYSIGGLQVGFSSVKEFIPIDILGLTFIYIGSTLILHGTRDIQITKKQIYGYVAGVVTILIVGPIHLFLNLPYYLIFSGIGFYVMYVCLLSAKTVYEFKDITDMSKIWLTSGLLVWALSWMIFPIVAILPDMYYYIITIQPFGVIITGASMLSLFISTVTQNLEQQYSASQIMSSLIQHDVRNYIHVAQSALELTEEKTHVKKQWLDVAVKSLDDAAYFINEMRDIYTVLIHQKLEHQSLNLASIVSQVIERVTQEYSLDATQIDCQIPNELEIKTCIVFKEILWNIFDNAFKHGTDILYIRAPVLSYPKALLEIDDRSGGLSDDIKNFFTSSTSLSQQVVPGYGLGLILIRGLTQLCGIRLQIEDVIENGSIVGTKFLLYSH